MRFVKKLDSVGKAYIYLDLEGLKLPNLPANMSDALLERLLMFRTDTYVNLRAEKTPLEWEMAFGVVHSFLNKLSDDEKIQYASLLILAHEKIIANLSTEQGDDKFTSPNPFKDTTGETLNSKLILELETWLSHMIDQFAIKLNLMPRLIEFVENDVKVQSFKGAGERPQDSIEMTFYCDDVVKLTAVVVLCKLLTPIFAVFMDACKRRMDNSLKESHCVAILKDVLHNNCQPLMEKLANFITRSAKPSSQTVEAAHLYNGVSFNRAITSVYSEMLVRRFVSADLLKPNGNLMTYVTACVRAAFSNKYSKLNRNGAAPLQSAKEKTAGDDGNLSDMEIESRSSSQTADYPLIIRLAIEELKKRFVSEHDLNTEAIEAATLYYSTDTHRVELTYLNAYLLGILFGDYLGGAKTVDSLDYKNLSEIIPIMQVYLIQQGYAELAHLVSARPGGQKTNLSGSEVQLKSSWDSSEAYVKCSERFPYQVGELRWDTQLEAAITHLCEVNYLYNSAPAIWELLGQDLANTQLVTCSAGLASNICQLILNQYPVM